jgi:hypothetical protein
LGRHLTDPDVDRVAMFDHRGDQFAGQGRGGGIALGVGQVSLEDGFRGALAEVGFEDRGERQSTSSATSALPVSLRRHRRSR